MLQRVFSRVKRSPSPRRRCASTFESAAPLTMGSPKQAVPPERPRPAIVVASLWRLVTAASSSFEELGEDPNELRRWGAVLMHAIRRPRHAMHWLDGSLHRRTPLEMALPWLSWSCVEFLEEFLRPGMAVLEYGGGGSTLYFARKGCRVVTVEGYRRWSRLIRARLDEALGDAAPAVEIREIAGIDDGEPPRDEYVRQVHSGGPWDVILVDGAHRLACLEASRDELRPNGVLIFDNADFGEYRQAPKLLSGFERRSFSGLGVGRRWTTQTDVYRRAPPDRNTIIRC